MTPYHPLIPPYYRRSALALVAVAGLWLIVLGALTSPQAGGRSPSSQPIAAANPAPEVGAPAPDFELRTPSGGTVRLRDLRGQAVLINFWATWCGPCRGEMPALQQVYEQYRRRGFTVVAVNKGEDVHSINDFLRQLNLTLPVALDQREQVAREYRVANIPSSFFIDRHGTIRARYVGPLSRSVLEAALEGLLP